MITFAQLRARVAPVFSPRPGYGIFGRLLPYNDPLDSIAGKYDVRRIGAEIDGLLARRAALAICEAIEERTREIADMEAELDIVLGFERS